jgi:hypothetical protein
MRWRSGHPERAGVMVQRLLQKAPPATPGRLPPETGPNPRLASAFRKAVGAVIAQHAQPRRLQRGVLHVAVDSPVWLQELTFLRAELAAKVSRVFGEEVREMKLRLARRPLMPLDTEHPPPSPPTPPAELTPEARAEVERATADLEGDPELREAVMRAMARWRAARAP